MDLLCKKNTELKVEELDVLFQLCKYNAQSLINCNKGQKFNTEEYRNQWIREALENNNLLCLECVENGYLIGFVFIILKEDENYINEFHIIDNYRHDGKTFRYIVNGIINVSQPYKDFTGRIWSENHNAQKIFKCMGAILKEGKYRLSYNKAKEWLIKDVNSY